MMRRSMMIFLVCLVFTVAPLLAANAKGVYIRDWITISVRSTPSEAARTIGLGNTNDFLEVIEEQEDWTKVRTPEGKEGWVQNRYLTKQTPKALIIDQLNEKVKSLTENNLTLREENKQLQKENRERSYKMSSSSKEIEKIQKDYEDLKTASSDYLELKKAYEKLQQENIGQTEKVDLLAKENSRLKTSERLIFTLIGGAFIIIGLVIGVLLQLMRARPKKAGYKF